MDEFIDRMGLVAEGDGLSRIAGRIMGLIVVDGGPLSFTQVAERLQISRASVSTNTRLLEHLGVIERVAQRGERQDFFQLSDAPYAKLLQGSAGRMEKARSVVEHAKKELAGSDSQAWRRLDELSGFYEALNKSFEELAARFSAKG